MTIADNAFTVLSHDTAAAVRRALTEQARCGGLTGCYYEFGVYQGHSLVAAYRTFVELGFSDFMLYGFDSFRGLPNPTAFDDDGYHSEGMFACSRRDVEAHLAHCGVDLGRVTLTEGFYDETLTDERRGTLRHTDPAVILIDCDFWDSSRRVLTFIAPMLRAGTLLLFDDWNLFNADPSRGQRRALAEFVAATGLSIEPAFAFGWHGQAMSVQ
jgi:hypothetical protein